MPKRVLVCGDRNWTDREAIASRLRRLAPTTVVVHGAARGADSIAGEEAQKLGLEVVAVPAEWSRHGRAAGPMRNSKMLEMLDPQTDIVIAFHADIGRSRGTGDTVRQAKLRNIRAYVIAR